LEDEVRSWLKRLERVAEGEMIIIPQQDGTVRRFPVSAARDAYLNLCERLGAVEDAPPEHPLLVAARNSSDAWWAQSAYAEDPEELIKPVEDLSES
jgi:hypothetical protein